MQILVLLAATVGLPYTLLASTSPLLQAWYVRTNSGAIPYRLFALSNFGSMLALLSYPLVVEPRMSLHSPGLYLVLGLRRLRARVRTRGMEERCPPMSSVAEAERRIESPAIAPRRRPGRTMLFWIGLAACASTLLLATTSHLTQNVAPIPLLWVVPLSIYLLSFILCFESGRLYQRWVFLPLLVAALWLFRTTATHSTKTTTTSLSS